MCGFLCLINYKYIDEQQFNKSLQTINHRGPDSTKAYTSSKVYFGFNRLSIRDLSVNGDQPMMNKTEDLVLVFNGEVYNYDKLKKILDDNRISLKSTSDTEVVLKLYSLFGIEKTLNLIEGMFGLVIYDKKTNKIFFARDRFGQKPIFYKVSNDGLVIASEIKAIISYDGKAEIDEELIINPLFTTGLPPLNGTCFKNIKSVSAGALLIYDLDSTDISKRKFFKIESLVDESLYYDINRKSETEVVHMYNELLHESIRYHIQSDAPLASLFSLGLDSTLISVIASRYQDVDLYHFRGELDDTDKYLNDFKSKFNLKIISVHEKDSEYLLDLPKMIYHYEMPNKEEGIALSSLCDQAYMDNIKVLLTGDSADELFGGYGHHLKFLTETKLYNSKLKRLMVQAIKYYFPDNIIGMPEYNPLGTSYNTSPSWNSLNEVPLNMMYHKGKRLKQWREYQEVYSFIKNESQRSTSAFLLDEMGYKLERFMIRGDRFGMMSSVELRNPFLYTPLVKLALNTPVEYKIKKNIFGKYKAKNILKEIAKINNVPRSIINRKKVGTPINSLLQKNKIIKEFDFSGVSSILNIKQSDIKYTLLNSYDVGIDRVKYSFISVEVLYKMFVENISHDDIRDNFKHILKL